MSQSRAALLGPPAKISETTFIGVAWGGVVLGLLFIAFRTFVRCAIFGRLQTDDGFVFFAWILLLTNTIIWQTGKHALYENIAVSAGELFPPPANFESNSEQYLRNSVAVIIFFYTGLWSIKLSFLIFFKKLGNNVKNQKIVWWSVFVITAASYFVCLGDIDYSCLASSFSYIETHCANTPTEVNFDRQTLRANMALDVVTDCLIIFVPFNLLWRVRLSIQKKLALSGIFSVTIIVMIFAIIRVIVVSSYSSEPDQSWLYMWSSIEQAVSIMVACLASFPSLFKKSEVAQSHWAGSKKLLRLLLSPRSWSRKTFKELSGTSQEGGSDAAFDLPNIPGGTMTGVRSFINKHGKTVSSQSQGTATTEEDYDSWPISKPIAIHQV